MNRLELHEIFSLLQAIEILLKEVDNRLSDTYLAREEVIFWKKRKEQFKEARNMFLDELGMRALNAAHINLGE